MAMVHAACLQMRLQASFAEAQAHARTLASQARDEGAQIALLPEYWYLPRAEGRVNGADARFAPAMDAVQRISAELGMALAGNAPERAEDKVWNTLFVFDGGALVAQQRKLHPMPTEESWGIAAAHELGVARWRGAALGALVCADVLHPEAARILGIRGAELVLNPVMSWWKPNDATGAARKAMFVARAYDNACFVLKAGSISEAGPGQLVGRSLIAAPWGLIAEAKDELAEEVVLADLDLERVREERKRSLSLGRRNPDAYAALAEGARSGDAREGG
jgi:predicted amidohydrolase